MKERPQQIVGSSPRLMEAIARATRVAPTRANVLLLGETGTGKELFARLIHDKSSRTGAFVTLNCTGIPAQLAESILFGHERGAFTGAERARLGVFREANGGTLFLDEIGDMAVDLQPRLLRAVQYGEILPVGASKPVKVDVRVVAATHHDLAADIACGSFRLDLHERLGEYKVQLPPLRERGRDVLAIAELFLQRAFPGKKLTRPAQWLLLEYLWPGNVRELENVVGGAAIDSGEGSVVTAGAVRAHVAARRAPPRDSTAAIVDVLHEKGRVSAADVQAATGVGRTKACALLKALEESGAIVRCRRGRATYYARAGSSGDGS